MAKIVELAVIPIIFVFMTMVSYGCSKAVTKLLKLEKRAANFVIAMVRYTRVRISVGPNTNL